ncbi:MAG TPA: outer membrane protein assembly factor BamD [Candidatus Acidoferrales bacterium]|nr:outer membrane protein assembly factor BamD [Candidatus Acidoferrales bacterium]
MNTRPGRHTYWLSAALAMSFLPAGCLFFGHKAKAPVATNASAAPDKILYDRAVNDYKHGRYTESRLSLQTLINSYPDSEYLAKAKLAVADSYFKEGGVDGLTQAAQEYKDFITFFPFLDEASYAQMQVAMSHYRMMEKPDRDATQARQAEQEFQTFLLKYPKSPLAPQATQHLREVQEVLGQADFDVARFYYIKGDLRASAARLIEVTGRYPLFSQSDRALWMMGDIFRRAARNSKNEQEKARWQTQADNEYAQLAKEYPLSALAAEAKSRLNEDGMKPPAPDPQALERGKYEAKIASHRPGILHKAMGMLKSSPDVSMAAHSGEPDLNPPEEAEAPQAIFAASPGTTTNGSSAGAGQNVAAQTVAPGEGTPPPTTTPAQGAGDPVSPATGDSTPPATGSSTTTGAANPPADVTPPANDSTPPAAADSSGAAKPQTDAGHKGKVKAPKTDKSKESTSKKKKGLRKLIPW